MTNSRNHHFLPQFYLRGFRSSGGSKKSQKVWSIRKTTSAECSEELIKDVACEEHFHTVANSDGTIDSDSIEDQLAKLETIYSPVRRKLLDGGKINPTERHLLSQFVCLMKMRTPAEKAVMDEKRSALADAMMRSLSVGDRIERELLQQPKYKNWPAPAVAELARRTRNAVLQGNLKISNTNASLLHPLFTTAFDPRFTMWFDKMRLEVLKAPTGSFFITGDQPVVLFDPTPPHLSKPGTGVACPSVEVTFPLSAQILLRFSWNHAAGERMATAAEVDEFNRRTVIMAKRSVFASRYDDAIVQLVRENQARSAGSSFTAMPLPNGKTMMLSASIPVRLSKYY
jgi:hypothetical protein